MDGKRTKTLTPTSSKTRMKATGEFVGAFPRNVIGRGGTLTNHLNVKDEHFQVLGHGSALLRHEQDDRVLHQVQNGVERLLGQQQWRQLPSHLRQSGALVARRRIRRIDPQSRSGATQR